MFPSAAPLAQSNCPSLRCKIIIVTGVSSGYSYELVKMHYQKNATVYLIAGYDAEGQRLVNDLRNKYTNSTGKVDCFILKFDNLTNIKQGVEKFKAKEKRLDILYNNAGAGFGAAGGRSA